MQALPRPGSMNYPETVAWRIHHEPVDETTAPSTEEVKAAGCRRLVIILIVTVVVIAAVSYVVMIFQLRGAYFPGGL